MLIYEYNVICIYFNSRYANILNRIDNKVCPLYYIILYSLYKQNFRQFRTIIKQLIDLSHQIIICNRFLKIYIYYVGKINIILKKL